MGLICTSAIQKERISTEQPGQHTHDEPSIAQEESQETHFFIQSKQDEGYRYSQMCVQYSKSSLMQSESYTNDETIDTNDETEEFVTPKSYHAYSFGSYPNKYYAG